MTDTFDPSNIGPVVPEPEMPEEIHDEFDYIADAGIDPQTVVTIHTNGGAPAYALNITEPLPFRDIMAAARLTWNGNLDIFMNGQLISLETPVAGGQTVTVVGNVKGG